MATATVVRRSHPGRDDRPAVGDGSCWLPRAAGRTGLVAAAVPALLMLAVGLVGLDRQSVWRDEAASLVAARRSLPELWAMLHHTEAVHAVYYLLLHGWLRLGSGEAWARVPSVLAMAVAVGFVGGIGARLVSTRVGLVAGLVVVANPVTSFYAQEARSSALVMATALVGTWFLLQAVERDRRWWVAYALAGVLLAGLNLLAVLVLLAHAATLLGWRLPRRVLAAWAVAAAPGGLLAVGLALVAARQPYQLGWIARPGPSTLRPLAHLLLGPGAVVVLLGAALLAAGLWRARSPYERRLHALVVPLLVLPAGVLLAVSLVQPVFVPRYVLPSVAASAWGVALGIDAVVRPVRRRRAPVALTAALVLLLGVLGLGTQRLDRTPASRTDDLAGVAAVIGARAQPGDTVLYLPDNRRLVALAYPAPFADLDDVGLAASPVAAADLTGRTRLLPAVLADLATRDRVWAIGRPGLTLLPSETAAAAELALLDRSFVPVEQTGAHGVGVTLYVRRSPAR